MRTGRPKAELTLSDEERKELEDLARRRRSAPALSQRARMVLACAKGEDNKTVARRVRVAPATVGKWRGRFVQDRVAGLMDEPRPGAPRQITDEQIEDVIVRTLESTPKGATHWSTRDMAKTTGLSHMTINRIWRAFGLQPHRTETFKLSPDPLLIEKVRDIVPQPARPRRGLLRRCQAADPGARPHGSPAPVAARTGGTTHPRLQTPRYHIPVCGPEHQVGQGDGPDLLPAARARAPHVPEPY